MSRRALRLVLASLAALVLVVVAQPAPVPAQEPPAPEDFTEACSNGIAVSDPEGNPDLVQDCAILLSARDALVGDPPNVISNLSWDAGKPIEQWPGVRLSRHKPLRVTALWLSDFILVGEIPPVLGSLSALEFLDLSRKYSLIEGLNAGLTGRIPSEIGTLNRLRTLILRNNSLEGEIPRELGDLVNLQRLDLRGNELTGELPIELGSLADLRSLELSSNDLTGEFPPELGRLTRLRTLSLEGNQLEGCLPPALYTASHTELSRPWLPECPEPAPGDSGTGLAPTPPGAVPIAVNVFAVLATVLAVLGIVAGFRTRYRP